MSNASLGIVIPTLNEEEALPSLLEDLRSVALPSEIVVSDGGSRDRTVLLARAAGVRVLDGPSGRARQMNAGARVLNTSWVLFLHADSRLPPETRRALLEWMRDPPPCEAAHFSFRLDREGLGWSLIERGQRIRERVTGLAYGDQGLLVSRARLERMEGIPDLPLMEDVEAVRRLRRSGGLDRIEAPLVSSARRYREDGPFRAWLRNGALISLYTLGVPPRILARWYRPRRWTAGRRPAPELSR